MQFVGKPFIPFFFFLLTQASFHGVERKGGEVGAEGVLISGRRCGHRHFGRECAFCSLLASALACKPL